MYLIVKNGIEIRFEPPCMKTDVMDVITKGTVSVRIEKCNHIELNDMKIEDYGNLCTFSKRISSLRTVILSCFDQCHVEQILKSNPQLENIFVECISSSNIFKITSTNVKLMKNLKKLGILHESDVIGFENNEVIREFFQLPSLVELTGTFIEPIWNVIINSNIRTLKTRAIYERDIEKDKMRSKIDDNTSIEDFFQQIFTQSEKIETSISEFSTSLRLGYKFNEKFKNLVTLNVMEFEIEKLTSFLNYNKTLKNLYFSTKKDKYLNLPSRIPKFKNFSVKRFRFLATSKGSLFLRSFIINFSGLTEISIVSKYYNKSRMPLYGKLRASLKMYNFAEVDESVLEKLSSDLKKNVRRLVLILPSSRMSANAIKGFNLTSLSLTCVNFSEILPVVCKESLEQLETNNMIKKKHLLVISEFKKLRILEYSGIIGGGIEFLKFNCPSVGVLVRYQIHKTSFWERNNWEFYIPFDRKNKNSEWIQSLGDVDESCVWLKKCVGKWELIEPYLKNEVFWKKYHQNRSEKSLMSYKNQDCENESFDKMNELSDEERTIRYNNGRRKSVMKVLKEDFSIVSGKPTENEMKLFTKLTNSIDCLNRNIGYNCIDDDLSIRFWSILGTGEHLVFESQDFNYGRYSYVEHCASLKVVYPEKKLKNHATLNENENAALHNKVRFICRSANDFCTDDFNYNHRKKKISSVELIRDIRRVLFGDLFSHVDDSKVVKMVLVASGHINNSDWVVGMFDGSYRSNLSYASSEMEDSDGEEDEEVVKGGVSIMGIVLAEMTYNSSMMKKKKSYKLFGEIGLYTSLRRGKKLF